MKFNFIWTASAQVMVVVAGYVASDSRQEAVFYGPVPVIFRQVVWERVETLTGLSDTHCAVQCLTKMERCKAFASTADKTCILLKDATGLSGNTWTDENNECKINLDETLSVRLPVFRVSAGSGVSVSDAWLSGPSSELSDLNTTQALNLGEPLTPGSYYRHPLLDNWENWNIKQVNVTLYTNKREVLELQFTVSSSSMTSWFSLENLSSSPWTDINTSPVNRFNLSITALNRGRRFYINSKFGGCRTDIGWLLVVDYFELCSFTKHPPYPALRYVTDTRQNWLTGDIRSADDLVVSVRITW